MTDDAGRVRRAPPPFRRATVTAVRSITPRLVRVDVAGPELVGIPEPEPAGSIRLLIPDGPELVLPRWDRNLFLHADGSRATLRTLTPVDTDPTAGTMGLEVVLHGAGRAADWARQAVVGTEVALSGPARGCTIPPDARTVLLAGDETAIAAIRQLAESTDARAEALVEIADLSAMLELPSPVEWIVTSDDGVPGTALADAVAAHPLTDVDFVWAGGEAAAVQRIRRDLYDVRGWTRDRAVGRGYWKFGRDAGSG